MMDFIKVDATSTEATGLLQRCRLLTKSAGTTNQTWSIEDYEIPTADVLFTGRIIGEGSCTRTEEVELYGMVCAAKVPADITEPSEQEGPKSLNIGEKPSSNHDTVRGWSLSTHSYSSAKKKQLRKIRSLSADPVSMEALNSLAHLPSLGSEVTIDGFSTVLKECRLLSTLHHPNVVQFFGVCWLEKESENTPVIIEELMLLSLREVATSFKGKLGREIPQAMMLSLLCDTARGLAYLHGHTPAIIHPNLKAHDVMVSSALVAKVTDLSNAQYGLTRHKDVQAFGCVAALMTGLTPEQMTNTEKDQLSEVESDLVSILVPCFSEDTQARPSITKVLERLEQLAKRVPFQLSQMGVMMTTIKEWRQEAHEHTLAESAHESAPSERQLTSLTESAHESAPNERQLTSLTESAHESAPNERQLTSLTESAHESAPNERQLTSLTESAHESEAISLEEQLREKDLQLAKLQEKNSELLAVNESIEMRLVEREQLEHSNNDVQLSDMLADLHDVIGWFLLGIHLGVPLSDLQKIRHQFGESVDQCKAEMLITYSKLMEPSWSSIIDALRKSGEQALATRLSHKHGVPLPETPVGEEATPPDSYILPGSGLFESEGEVQQLMNRIQAKDSELQRTVDQLQREQATKEDLEKELVDLRNSLSSLQDDPVSFQQSRQMLSQQLFLKERERHYLSLVGTGVQHKERSMHGNEIDIILVEKDQEINRVRSQLKELETKFSVEKSHSEDLKSRLSSVESELAVKCAYIVELEKSKEEVSRYLADERQRVDMLLMKVVPPVVVPPVVAPSQDHEEHSLPKSTSSTSCCVIV